MDLPPSLTILLPVAGLALLTLGIAFEAAGQPLSRVGPVLALVVAVVLSVRLIGRWRR